MEQKQIEERKPVLKDILNDLVDISSTLNGLLELLEDVRYMLSEDITSNGVPRKSLEEPTDKPTKSIKSLRFDGSELCTKARFTIKACYEEVERIMSVIKLPELEKQKSG